MKPFYLSHNRQAMSCTAYPCLLLGLAKPVTRKRIRGFSLLELVVVIALLSIVALSATTLIIDNGDLKRQQATETRWNQIHDAIISQPNLYLNGSPYVRGYVADMGRLPVGIVELISRTPTYDHDDDDDTPEVPIPYDEDDDVGTADITIVQPDWQSINLGYTPSTPTTVPPSTNGATHTAELHGGWRGPYLYTAGNQQFRDGWGREGDLGFEEDLINSGWEVNTDGEERAEVTDLFVQSYGLDQEQSGTGDFTRDFPIDPEQTIVSESEWLLSASPITFNINFSNAIRDTVAGARPVTLPPNVPATPAGDPQELELRVYRYVDDGDNDVDGDDLLTVRADAAFTLTDGASAASTTITPQEADFAAGDEGMPIGRYAALVWCTNNNNYPIVTPGFTDDTVYDGDCDGDPVDHSPVYFTLTNNTSQVTLTWDLP